MFGYACDETPELMPLPIMLAHKLCQPPERRAPRRACSTSCGPTARARSASSTSDNKPVRIDAVVISTQHSPDVSTEELRARGQEAHHRCRSFPADMVDAQTKYHINPTGRFVVGGPHGDTGLTGRKIIVDTYGGMGRHGGGAFSGKDPTKVDRSACYMARYIAKNLVAAGLADALRSAAGLRHRRRRAGLGDGEHVRHRHDRRRAASPTWFARTSSSRRAASSTPEPAPSDLPQDGRVRPLRPHRRHLHLGSHRQGRRAKQSGRRRASRSE